MQATSSPSWELIVPFSPRWVFHKQSHLWLQYSRIQRKYMDSRAREETKISFKKKTSLITYSKSNFIKDL